VKGCCTFVVRVMYNYHYSFDAPPLELLLNNDRVCILWLTAKYGY